MNTYLLLTHAYACGAPDVSCSHQPPIPHPCVTPQPTTSPSLTTPRLHRIAAPERLAVDQPAPASDEKFNPNEFANLSYSEQYDRFYNKYHKDGELIPVRLGASLPRTDPDKQAAIPGAKKVLFSSVYATPKTHQIFDREYNSRDMIYVGFMVFVHGLALLAPFTFSWNNLALFMGMYFVSGCLGITLSFHRQLSHKAFKTPKWLEYALAYCGVMAVQGDPIEWVSCHR